MMLLYHGSNVAVRRPILLQKQRKLDFGRGFYTTTDLEQAKKWAKRTADIRKTGKGYVSVYEIEDDAMSRLRIFRFEKADRPWLDYVVQNRRGQGAENGWDVVYGPVANDQTMQTIVLHMDGFLTAEQTIRNLLPQKLKDQLAFKTEKALSCLHCIEVIEVE